MVLWDAYRISRNNASYSSTWLSVVTQYGDGNTQNNIIIIIIIKKDWQCKARRVRLTPYQSEDPSPTLPTYRGKEEKGTIVEDQKWESN